MTEKELMTQIKGLSYQYWQAKIGDVQFSAGILAIIKEAGYVKLAESLGSSDNLHIKFKDG